MNEVKYPLSSKWLILWSLWCAGLVRQPTPALRISSGLLRGSIANDGSHKHFLGIPYATVKRRFLGPGPEPKWTGVFEAIDEHIRCYQITGIIIRGQEDCLILNVYTPLNASPDKPLPVMVFIHGGAFFYGSSSRFLFGPEYLVAKNIILVSINYRLNVFGYLCLGISDAPGNAGMKDQVAALKWIQKNIRVFGGDPDNVTIFGESAGAASVSLHLVSPMSKGLFHKAIAQSGSAISLWAIGQHDPTYTASILAKAMGYYTENASELFNFFMSKSEVQLISTEVPRPEGETFLSEFIFVPCVERWIEGEQHFLTDLPYNLFASGNYNKVPMIIGSNDQEGYFCSHLENDTVLPKIVFEKALPKDLSFPSEEERKVVGNEVQTLYMGDKQVCRKNILNLLRYYGDAYFNYPAAEETQVIIDTSDQPVYSYYFTYNGWRNLAKYYLGLPFALAPGASHGDELFYLFKPCMVPSFLENKMIDRMTTLWTNFSKYGVPDVSGWPPTDPRDPRTLVLNVKPNEMLPLWHSTSLLYWRQLYKKYRRTQHINSEL